MDKHILRLILKILLPASGWFLLCFFGPRCLKFFMPFVIGWLISMLANPLVRFLERKLCLVRKHSSMVIVAGALALVIGLIYLAVFFCPVRHMASYKSQDPVSVCNKKIS